MNCSQISKFGTGTLTPEHTKMCEIFLNPVFFCSSTMNFNLYRTCCCLSRCSSLEGPPMCWRCDETCDAVDHFELEKLPSHYGGIWFGHNKTVLFSNKKLFSYKFQIVKATKIKILKQFSMTHHVHNIYTLRL